MLEHWYPVSIAQTELSGGFSIVLTTDVPCHLWLCWTSKVPWVHRVTRLERGLTVPWDSYWCYVVWHVIDQDEPGDTLIHTYTWLGWQVCQTKYFRFHGKICGEVSPSDSPIFWKHYTYVPPPVILQEFWHLDGVHDIFGVMNPNGVGYSFDAAASYTLDHIVGWFTVRAGPSFLDVAIYNAGVDWKPTGAPLATAQIDKNGLQGWPNKLPKDIPLSGAPIVAGQKYAVTFLTDCAAPGCGWHVWWRTGASPYKIITTFNQGTTWAPSPAWDSLVFENWGG